VTQTDDGKAGSPTDLLGCPLGWIAETAAWQFTNHSASHALETIASIEHRPFASLKAALAAVGKRKRNGCRRNPGEDQRQSTVTWRLPGSADEERSCGSASAAR
jgi:hypothetical protein